MKQEGLRIGNYLKANYDFEDESLFKIVKVIAIDGTDGGLMDYELLFECGDNELYYNWEPISLTEEWLLKCGFEWKEYSLFNRLSLTKNSFTIEFEISDNICDCYLEMIGIDILFVHQLQNLYFALIGEELTVKFD